MDFIFGVAFFLAIAALVLFIVIAIFKKISGKDMRVTLKNILISLIVAVIGVIGIGITQEDVPEADNDSSTQSESASEPAAEESSLSEGNQVNEDETKQYKLTPGEVKNNSLIISLEVRSEDVIKDQEMIDNIRSVETTVRKLHDQKDEKTGEVFENVYQVNGVFSWENKRYNYVAVYNFDDNDVDESGTILIYNSDLGHSIINRKMDTVK